MPQKFKTLQNTLLILVTLLLISCVDKSDSPTQHSGMPGIPENLQAVIDVDGFRLNWQTPKLDTEVTFYIIERAFYKSVDAALNFQVIEANFTNTILEFIEPFPSDIAGDKYIYQITAGNNIGNGKPVRSNIVDRSEFINVSDYPAQVILPFNRAKGLRFSRSLAISADGNTMAVGNLSDIFIYERDNLGEWNVAQATILKGNSEGQLAALDQSLTLSNDGLTLAVFVKKESPNYTSVSSSVHLYNRNNNGAWDTTPTQIILSPTAFIYDLFGYKLVFSPDAQDLAISNSSTGKVYLYSKNNNGTWQNTANSVLVSQEAISRRRYQFPIAFSPDGTTLAMGDSGVLDDTRSPIGTVKLFTKLPTGLWNTTPTLELFSITPGLNFGQAVAFSHDGNTLAVTEIGTALINQRSIIKGSANVQLFNRDTSGNWDTTPSTVFKSQSGDEQFGKSLAFNVVDDQLAIAGPNSNIIYKGRGFYYAGTVQLFTKDSMGNWMTSPQSILSSSKPGNANHFGHTMAFSQDNTLVVGELLGTGYPPYMIGSVHIFDTTKLR